MWYSVIDTVSATEPSSIHTYYLFFQLKLHSWMWYSVTDMVSAA